MRLADLLFLLSALGAVVTFCVGVAVVLMAAFPRAFGEPKEPGETR